jgi:uncharacterized SAM-binding protein YcdF (DUF218 family)
MARKQKWFKALFYFLFYISAGWTLGFGFFYLQLPKAPIAGETYKVKTDALIVLTGGKGRLETALNVLKNNTDKRLLISGVNPVVEQSELSALTGSEATLFDCCVDLDRKSKNTAANAYESAKWIQSNNYRTVTIITADYHVPRSMVLFKNAAPNVLFTGYAVTTDAELSFLIREYNKYLFTVIQLGVGVEPTVRVVELNNIQPDTNNTEV